ncbi:MAG: hypothetical protein HYX75_02880 [Acidobacteria bacterium]|nr:hypothetical protein [Acidobacteriota bacterium]
MSAKSRLVLMLGLSLAAVVLCLWHQSSGWSRSLAAPGPGGGMRDVSASWGSDGLAPQNVEIKIVSEGPTLPFCIRICVQVKSDGQTWPGMKVNFKVTSGPHSGRTCTGVTPSNGIVCCEFCADGVYSGKDEIVIECEGKTVDTYIDWGEEIAELEEWLEEYGCLGYFIP